MRSIIKGNLVYLFLLFFFVSNAQTATIEEENINKVLNIWHKAAAQADYTTYFDQMTEDGVFIGTDATENWQNKAFKVFSKPYFDKGKAWSFTTIERNVYIDNGLEFAWFDELLDTQMKICRGSGVLHKVDGAWKIKHYVLSITIPNENVNQVVEMKKSTDNQLIKGLRK